MRETKTASVHRSFSILRRFHAGPISRFFLVSDTSTDHFNSKIAIPIFTSTRGQVTADVKSIFSSLSRLEKLTYDIYIYPFRPLCKREEFSLFFREKSCYLFFELKFDPFEIVIIKNSNRLQKLLQKF